jgi:hypothetical protein
MRTTLYFTRHSMYVVDANHVCIHIGRADGKPSCVPVGAFAAPRADVGDPLVLIDGNRRIVTSAIQDIRHM